MRFRGLSGSRGWRLGDGGGWAARGLGERGDRWTAGRFGVRGPIRVRAGARRWGPGFVGDGAGDFSSFGVFECEGTLQDLRRGNASVG